MSKHGRYWGLSQKRRALEEELDEQRAYNLHAAKIIKPKELEAGQFKCGGKFVLRQNKKNKEYFYG